MQIGRSLWSDTCPVDERIRAEPLDGDTSVDVAVVGGGLTGLWTALHLTERDPSIRVAVIERHSIGFGASGRNGGWCSALLPMSHTGLARRHGERAAVRMQVAMHDNLDRIEAFVDRHAPGDRALFQRGGTVDLARNRAQRDRLRADVGQYHDLGFGDDDHRWLEPDEVDSICRATHVLGAAWTRHCAVVHPLRLTNLVARVAAENGVVIHERTAAVELGDRRVVTDRGTVRADVVVRATEGYTPLLASSRREVIPVYSMMIATEPLPAAVWDEIGLEDRPTFADGRRMVIYGQRTADDRLAFGGRGAPYHFGSSIRPRFDTDERIRALLTRSLTDLFPAIGTAAITHHWGGVLAAPRDWTCAVRFDRTTGFATAGGYVGDGLSTTHLAGRTLAALIIGDDADDECAELTRLPWVGHRSRAWEPEPVRWVGINLARSAAARADRVEHRTGRRSAVFGRVVDAVTGR